MARQNGLLSYCLQFWLLLQRLMIYRKWKFVLFLVDSAKLGLIFRSHNKLRLISIKHFTVPVKCLEWSCLDVLCILKPVEQHCNHNWKTWNFSYRRLWRKKKKNRYAVYHCKLQSCCGFYPFMEVLKIRCLRGYYKSRKS